jgi:hypothetical protein
MKRGFTGRGAKVTEKMKRGFTGRGANYWRR